MHGRKNIKVKRKFNTKRICGNLKYQYQVLITYIKYRRLCYGSKRQDRLHLLSLIAHSSRLEKYRNRAVFAIGY